MSILNFESLAKTAERRAVLEIVEAGLAAIRPEKVLANWKLEDESFDRVFLLGFGKGSAAIAKILEDKLGDTLTSGWVIDTVKTDFRKIEFTLGTHPLPSQVNVDFTRKVVANKFNSSDLVIVVVCGGGSAMLTDPTVSLSELIATNEKLLRSGMPIAKMNAERKKIDRVKGGGLAKLLAPAKVRGLIFSDVPGNDLAVIASGPTVAAGVENILMLSNLTALAAMKKKAEELGYAAEIYSDRIFGEAREVGRRLVDATTRRMVLLAGGETTVMATGNGQGGRNQEVVLGALPLPSGMVICAVDSDGWDNSPVAGAIGDSLKLDPTEFLGNNDSYNYFQKTGDFIETGRLPANIADLIVVLKND